MKLVFFSLTGQSRRFVKKLGSIDSLELKKNQPLPKLDQPFICLMPTYEAGLDFLRPFFKDNRAFLKGFIGTGNRNFGPEFCHTAKELATAYNVPLLYTLEFSGTEHDVETVKGILNNES